MSKKGAWVFVRMELAVCIVAIKIILVLREHSFHWGRRFEVSTAIPQGPLNRRLA